MFSKRPGHPSYTFNCYNLSIGDIKGISQLTKVFRDLFSDITSFLLGTKKTVGEFFNPGLNCSDILDKLDDAKDGFYWITLKRSNPVKVSVFVVFNIHHFRLFPSCFEIL